MVILAGIDEAGFGPLLGPLVVSSCAFEVADDTSAQADLWSVLAKSVGKTRKHLRGRLLVTDSKKAYKRGEGLGHLERSVLATLGSLGRWPADLGELIEILCPACTSRLRNYPWYQDTGTCPLPVDQPDLRIASNVFTSDMNVQATQLVHVQSDCLDVAYYNTMIQNVKNKAQVLFVATTRLIQNILERFRDRDIRIFVDRQGGRIHYREHLLRSFADMELSIVHESEQRSAYTLQRDAQCLHLSFEVKADDVHMPVSLASMVSKYLRELLMESVNRYFSSRNPDLKPTAGYWTDGLRFLDDVRRSLPDLQINDQQLVRCR